MTAVWWLLIWISLIVNGIAFVVASLAGDWFMAFAHALISITLVSLLKNEVFK